MSQFGMQMPGGQAARRPGPDVYTALMVFATVALALATVFVVLANKDVAPDGNLIGLQEPDRIELAETARP